jgi:diguanylate cyclase (GGDEF)-like protein
MTFIPVYMTEQTTINTLKELILQELTQQIALSLSECVEKTMHATSVELYKKLESAEDWLRADFSLAINLLEANREWFAAQLTNEAIAGLKSGGQQKSSNKGELNNESDLDSSKGNQKALSLDNLSLVSKGDFEDWLAANVAIKMLEAELGYEMQETSYIFSSVLSRPLDNETNPIGAQLLIGTLKRSIDELEIPATPQAVLYKAAARSLKLGLADIYASVISTAKKHQLSYINTRSEPRSTTNSQSTQNQQTDNNHADIGDVPSIGSSVDSGSRLADSVHGDAVGGDGGSSQSQPLRQGIETNRSSDLHAERQVAFPNNASNAGDSTLNTLSRLNTSLSSGGYLGGHESPEGGGKETVTQIEGQYAPAQLVGAISQLQQISGHSEVIERKKLRNWIQTGLKQMPGGTKNIGEQESEIIDVTDRFFEVIIEKIGVSGLLEKWLEKLKLTILKVVLRDKTFFSNSRHPARQMLNKLAKLASSDKTDKKRLEKVLDRFIDRVVSEFDQDESVIEKVVEEIDALLERQVTAQKRNSDRIARAYEGKQKVANARHLVVKDINDLIANCSVPVVLIELLDKAGWREHITLVSVRDGHQSDAYKEALNVIDLLLNWLGEETDDSDKWALELEMELEAPSILDLITKELSVVGLVGYEAILKRLEDCLFHDVDPLLVKMTHYEWPYDKSEKEIKELRPDQGQDPQATHWHKRVVTMKVGDWIEIKDEQGRARSLRLAWSGSESFRFVFVDSQGMKDEDLPLDTLVEMFRNNQASFVDSEEVPLVDQGLHQMVQSVYEELASQSSCDVLTGLLNRQAFERGLEQSISGAVTNESKATLIYIDVDKFSLTNTSYGHHAGDALLKHVADIIKAQGLEDAFCGRLGGNEFGMILVNCSLKTSQDVANQICTQVNKAQFSWEDHTIGSTVSIGLADFDIESDSYDTLMRKAGVACQSARDLGRNRVVVYEALDKDQHKRDEMIHWVQRLDENLDELLTLRCQEIRPISTDGEAKPHYEILLGVRENGQVLPPSMLIEAAEHFGRMAKVDRWVIHNVLKWMEEHEASVARSNGFSINLSGNSISDDSFLEFILGQFAASTVPPELICFEITETAAITNLADAIEFIRVLKQTGCKFSLDDFGSGLSSYAYIQKLPVDFIKIDGIFIRNIANNERDQALVKSINELAHFMGMKTVAEYVENYEILSVLRSIGVDHSQGFGIKKPGLLADLA